MFYVHIWCQSYRNKFYFNSVATSNAFQKIRGLKYMRKDELSFINTNCIHQNKNKFVARVVQIK